MVFACQGIEPCQANADAGTRRPQVRTRRPQVRTRFLLAMKKINDRLTKKINDRLTKKINDRLTKKINDRLTKKINDRLMMINVQKKAREASLILSYLILFIYVS